MRRKKLAIGSLDPFRDGDNAVAVSRQSLLDLGQEPLLIERDLGQQQNMGASPSPSAASAQAAVVHPACRPITSNANTLVEVRLIDAKSNAASRIEVATYFATEPKPGEQSVIGRSLSTVLGMPTHTIG